MSKEHPAPMDPLPAATLILVREQAGELQVYLLLRGIGASFMSGKYVFPGGRVDPADLESVFWTAHADLDPAGIERRFGGDLSADAALAFAVTAIRETLEEAGVFLGRKRHSRDSGEGRTPPAKTHKGLSRTWFQEEAAWEGWILELSRLYRWARWITPELMKPRFDTRFFLAFMPENQTCRPDLREVTRGEWITPKEALEKNLTGEIPLSPPTAVTLQELTRFPTARRLTVALEKRTWGEPLLPRLIPIQGGGILLEPWDADYHGSLPQDIHSETLKNRVLRAGEPFSKLWHDGSVWRPVQIENGLELPEERKKTDG